VQDQHRNRLSKGSRQQRSSRISVDEEDDRAMEKAAGRAASELKVIERGQRE
jgi:hypothetical protein